MSQRLQEVAHLVLGGLSNAQISEQLSLTINTVKTHLRHIFRATDVRSREELAAYLITTYRDDRRLDELASSPLILHALDTLYLCSEKQLAFLNKLADNPGATDKELGNGNKDAANNMVRAIAKKLGVLVVENPRTILVTVCLLARRQARAGAPQTMVKAQGSISRMEGRVLIRLVSGRTDAVIARELGIDESEVPRYLAAVARRTGQLNERTTLALFVIRTLLTDTQLTELRGMPVLRRFRRAVRFMSPWQRRVFDLLVVLPGVDNRVIASRLGMRVADVGALLDRVAVACGLEGAEHVRLQLTVFHYLVREH
ncbi:MAG TPA: helix-turn-helix transcriptional regulator [Candidatus Saccharimonadales bacterium]|nr:helix-turn-helix transcriptional regulator [Candidatus Saccharimonadales bacterium]